MIALTFLKNKLVPIALTVAFVSACAASFKVGYALSENKYIKENLKITQNKLIEQNSMIEAYNAALTRVADIITDTNQRQAESQQKYRGLYAKYQQLVESTPEDVNCNIDSERADLLMQASANANRHNQTEHSDKPN